jgi:hypothetical protein
MRPWFTFVVICLIVLSLLVFLFIVDFVLLNRAMFDQSFNIQIRFLAWSHTWTEIPFMYIVAASILIGSLVIAITTLGLDTQRALKVRSLKKELKRLQQSLQEAQSNVSKASPSPEAQTVVPHVIEPSPEVNETSSPTPNEINKSFEDVVQKSDFLERATNQPADDVQDAHDEQPPAEFFGTEVQPQEAMIASENIPVVAGESGPATEPITNMHVETSSAQPVEPMQAPDNLIVTGTPENVQRTKEHESEA